MFVLIIVNTGMIVFISGGPIASSPLFLILADRQIKVSRIFQLMMTCSKMDSLEKCLEKFFEDANVFYVLFSDLMLPGVIMPTCGLPLVDRGTLCSIAVVGNRYDFS